MTWIILGLVIGVSFYFLATRQNFKLRWYEWILAVLSVILILFTIQNYNASQLALEPRAAGMFIWMFGLPGVILGVLAGVLAFLRNRRQA